MIRLIMGSSGAGKTKQLIQLVNTAITEESGCVVCIADSADMRFDISNKVRLIDASEYKLSSFETLRGFVSGLYAGNYDISHVFVDNLCKIVGEEPGVKVEEFLAWLDKFSFNNGIKFTVTINADPETATEGMRKYL